MAASASATLGSREGGKMTLNWKRLGYNGFVPDSGHLDDEPPLLEGVPVLWHTLSTNHLQVPSLDHLACKEIKD